MEAVKDSAGDPPASDVQVITGLTRLLRGIFLPKMGRRPVPLGEGDDMTIKELTVYGAIGPLGGERRLAWELLALALERELGLTRLPEIAREPGGRPYFPDCPQLCFNISHSRGGAVCALDRFPVGVDVERLRPAPRRLAGDLPDGDFFRLWTAREATVKRRGLGIGALVGGGPEPDPLCQCLENFLPGYVVTVCPSRDIPARTALICGRIEEP